MEDSTLQKNLVASQVIYRGHVQGVGFRRTTADVAKSFTVTGYVRNLDDGGVELVAEGQREELARFLSAVAERLSRYISSAQDKAVAPTGAPTFTIRR